MFNFFKKAHVHTPTRWERGFGYLHLYALNSTSENEGTPWHRTCTECGKLQVIAINDSVSDLNGVDEKLLKEYIKEKQEYVYKDWD